MEQFRHNLNPISLDERSVTIHGMNTDSDSDIETPEVKYYPVKYPRSAYIFPKGARVYSARIDEKYLHIELMDGRLLAIPLHWIPTLNNAPPDEREKFEINDSRTRLIWDPEKCAIEEEVLIADYLGPHADFTP